MMAISIFVEMGGNLYLTSICKSKQLLLVWFQRRLFPHWLDETVEKGKDDGLVHGSGDARGDIDGVDKLEAEWEDGGEEEASDKDLWNKKVKVKACFKKKITK